MGKQKLLLPVDGRRLLDRALETAASWPTIVVLSPDLATEAPPRDDLTVIVNGEPELGMVHSLRLGNAQVPSEAAIAVLLADTPLVDRALVATVSAARGDADVAYPVRAGTPGHPVIFG